jgi:predicted ATP-dependent serine protease
VLEEGAGAGTKYRAPSTQTSSAALSGARHLVPLDVNRLLTEEPPDIKWLVGGVVARGHLTMLVGAPKDGKSLFLFRCAAVGSNGGGELAGIPVAPLTVLYVDAENGEHEIHRRIHGEPVNVERFHLYEARGLDLLRHSDELRHLCDSLNPKPDLIVLDSWRPLWTGDEIKPEETDRCLTPLRNLAHEMDLGIVLIHHTPKYDTSVYRGGGAIGAAVEMCMLMHNEGEKPHKIRKLEIGFTRFRPTFEEYWFVIGENAEIQEADAVDKAPKSINTAKLLPKLEDGMTWKEWTQAAGINNKNGAARDLRDKMVANNVVRVEPGERRQDDRYFHKADF